MTGQLRLLGAFGLASIALLASTESASAVTYVASLLAPVGFNYSNAYGIGGSGIAGTTQAPFDASNPNHFSDAALWNTATNSLVNLNPGPDWHSSAYGASNDSQVGQGRASADNDHALLWHGTAASFVDLNPTGFYTSQAYGVSGNNQVGGGGLLFSSGGQGHALLWHGTAASAVDLNPSGYAGSVASSVLGDSIVGTASLTGNNDQHATLWTGPSHTRTDLHPAAGFPSSGAFGISADSQVGTGFLTFYFSGDRHALLWHDTAASVVDLNPTGFTRSEAYSVAGSTQVGYGMGPSTDNQNHAFLWQGTAASGVDLHGLLAGLPQSFVSSEAHGIDANGVIVGFATASDFATYAVKWTPVPEPSTVFLTVIGIVMIGAGRRGSRSRL